MPWARRSVTEGYSPAFGRMHLLAQKARGGRFSALSCAVLLLGLFFVWEVCNLHRIDEIRPGVAMIIFDEQGNVLLQKRSDVGLWGIPSGHIEPGETAMEAAIREVREETGLHTTVKRFIGVYSDPASQVFTYPNGRVVHFVTLCFEMRTVGGVLSTASPETLDVQFFAPCHLPKDLLPMHPTWLSDALARTEAAFIR